MSAQIWFIIDVHVTREGNIWDQVDYHSPFIVNIYISYYINFILVETLSGFIIGCLELFKAPIINFIHRFTVVVLWKLFMYCFLCADQFDTISTIDEVTFLLSAWFTCATTIS